MDHEQAEAVANALIKNPGVKTLFYQRVRGEISEKELLKKFSTLQELIEEKVLSPFPIAHNAQGRKSQ